MVRVVLTLLFVAVVLVVVAFVDCVTSEPGRVRTLPKAAWLVLILLVPVVGAILWFVFGHARSGGDSRTAPPPSPDDDPSFLEGLDQEQRVRRLEEELERLDEEERRHRGEGGSGA